MKLPGAEDGLVCPASELFRFAAVWGRSEVVPVRWEEVLVRAVATLACSAEDLVRAAVALLCSEETLEREALVLPSSAEDLVLTVPVCSEEDLVRATLTFSCPEDDFVLVRDGAAVPERSALFRERSVFLRVRSPLLRCGWAGSSVFFLVGILDSVRLPARGHLHLCPP